MTTATDTAAPIATTRAGRLRRIEAVLRDRDLTRAEAVAVVGVILHANGRGLCWPGQRRLRYLFHLSGAAVAGGLRKAVGTHLGDAGIGPRGVRLYRVHDAPDVPRKAKASAPVAGTLNDPPARRFDDSSAPILDSSAPESPAQRACGRHETNNVNQNREPKEREPEQGDGTDSLSLESEGTVDSRQETAGLQETSTADDDRDRLVALAFPGGATPRQRAALVNSAAAATRAGVPTPFLAHALLSSRITGTPWERVDKVIEKASDLVAEFGWVATAAKHAGVRTLSDLVAWVQTADPAAVPKVLCGHPVRTIVEQASVWPEENADAARRRQEPSR